MESLKKENLILNNYYYVKDTKEGGFLIMKLLGINYKDKNRVTAAYLSNMNSSVKDSKISSMTFAKNSTPWITSYRYVREATHSEKLWLKTCITKNSKVNKPITLYLIY